MGRRHIGSCGSRQAIIRACGPCVCVSPETTTDGRAARRSLDPSVESQAISKHDPGAHVSDEGLGPSSFPEGEVQGRRASPDTWDGRVQTA